MELRVIGCHGGETPKHRTSAFVLDRSLAIDAGSLTSGLTLKEQCGLSACLVSHAHLDHIRDLATIADNRCQSRCPPLVIAAIAPTIAVLKKHFFNDLVWPDFTKIPSPERPTITYQKLVPEKPARVAGRRVRAILVDHTIDSSAFIIESDEPGALGGAGAIAYSGDTGPTDRFWSLLNEQAALRALLVEVSFPNREQRLATASGHHTPKTLAADLRKCRLAKELPALLYHVKPSFQAEVERECAALRGLNLTVLSLGDRFVL